MTTTATLLVDVLLMIRYTVSMDNLNSYSEKDTTTPEASSEQPTTPTAQEQPAPMPFKLPIKEVDDGKGKLIAIILAIAVALVIAVGAIVYFFALNKPAENSVVHQSVGTTRQPTKSKGAQSVISAIENIVHSTVVKATMDKAKGYAVTADNVAVYTYPIYKLPSRDYATGPTTGYGMAVSASANNKASVGKDYSAIVALLEKDGFKPKQLGPIDDNLDDGTKSSLYATDFVVCVVHSFYSPDPSGTHYASSSCADMASFEEQAKVVEPFYKLFAAELPDKTQLSSTDANPLIISGPIISDGASGYKNAQVGFSKLGITAMFYQEPGKDWKYATGMTKYVPVTCQTFNTPELKKAFAGTYCYETTTDTDSTVKS